MAATAFDLSQIRTDATNSAATFRSLIGFSEAVDDEVNSMLVAGSNVTLTYDDNANTLTVAAAGGSGVPAHPGFRDNYYYSSYPCIAPGTMTLVANRLYYVPILIPVAWVPTRIGINVTTLVASNTGIRLGIYNSSNGVPSTLLLDAGTVSAATTGEKEITISQSLSAGWYWLALASQGTASITAENAASSGDTARTMLGAATGAGNHIVYYYQSHTYAVLPTVGTLVDTTGASNPPRVWLRKV